MSQAANQSIVGTAPDGVTIRPTKNAGGFRISLKSTPGEIKRFFLWIWFFLSLAFVLTAWFEPRTGNFIVDSIIVGWFGVPVYQADRFFYYLLGGVPVLLLVPFLCMGRCFPMTVVVESGEMRVSGLRSRRWNAKGVSTIKFIARKQTVPPLKPTQRDSGRHPLFIKVDIHKSELTWLNQFFRQTPH